LNGGNDDLFAVLEGGFEVLGGFAVIGSDVDETAAGGNNLREGFLELSIDYSTV
jgi:hypothetical protein